METVQIKINKKKYNVLLALTEEEREQGLQDVEEMDSNEGCLFVFGEVQPEVSFWMHNTELPLLLCFINEDKEVISVAHGKPNDETPITEENVKYVLEVNDGEDIESGDVLEYNEEDGADDIELEPNKMYIIGSDGAPQAELVGGERIMSRASTRVILRKAEKAFKSKSDVDYKSLGRYIFNELSAQESREPQYVESKENKEK